jgi:hypothetical protein
VGPASTEYAAVARRSTALGIVLVVIMVVFEFLMTTKPQFCG